MGGSTVSLMGGSVFQARPLTLFLSILFILVGILLILSFTTIEFATTESKYIVFSFLGLVLLMLFVYILYINFNSSENS